MIKINRRNKRVVRTIKRDIKLRAHHKQLQELLSKQSQIFGILQKMTLQNKMVPNKRNKAHKATRSLLEPERLEKR